jgi:sulfur carrier protein ThiS
MKLMFRDKEWQLDEERLTLREALEKIGMGPEVVLAMRDGQVLLADTILKKGDVVRLMPLVSGGQL